MDEVAVTIPQTPFTLVPGEETRIPVELRNDTAEQVSVRVSVAPSRAGAWAPPDPSAIALAPGAQGTVELPFRPPPGTPVAAALLPFTVQVEDLRYGAVLGRATGLVTVSAPEHLAATLTAEPGGRGTVHFVLDLCNRGAALLTVRLAARLDPPGAPVVVEPPIVALPGGQSTTVRVRARPKPRLVGSASLYAVEVDCHDVTDDGAPPLATAEATGRVPPRLGRTPAAVLAVFLLVAVMSAAVLIGGVVDLPGRGRTPPASAPPAATQVRRPYALIDVFPRHDGPGGRADAEALLARLTAAGMTVRLVDSTTSDDVADGDAGLWVLLRDGMSSMDEVRAYCDRYRAIAPKCDVVP
jgi:hypothetical protein